MKKAIITVLGLAGYNVNQKKLAQKCQYFFKECGVEGKEYYNVLPLLIDCYKGYEIIPLYTLLAKEAQSEVLKAEGKEEFLKIFDHPLAKFVEDENKLDSYDTLLKKIDSILDAFNDEDEVIVDITHGLRHMPLLMIIDAIVQNIKNPGKIKKIIFAKEIERNKKYEVIDLSEYLDLAMVVMLLNTFTRNYTLAGNIKFKNNDFNKLKEYLEEFSINILSNSIYSLTKENGIIDKILIKIDKLSKNSKIEPFIEQLENIKSYLRNIKYVYQSDIPLYEKHFFTAKEMYERNYYLNTFTFLNEAIAIFAKELIESLDREIKNSFKIYLKRNKKNGLYKVTSECKNFILFLNEKEINIKNRVFREKKDKIRIKLNSLKYINELKLLIKMTNSLRNDLAHVNMTKPITQIKEKLQQSIKTFEKIIKENNG
jgi:CRISPR-associated DxTHG motif protein